MNKDFLFHDEPIILKLNPRASRYKTDGLNSLKFEMLSRIEEPLYTNLTVHLFKNPYQGVNG